MTNKIVDEIQGNKANFVAKEDRVKIELMKRLNKPLVHGKGKRKKKKKK
jgi:hypothetical protein